MMKIYKSFHLVCSIYYSSEDSHGNAWFALVIDPLRSLAKNVPEIKVRLQHLNDINNH